MAGREFGRADFERHLVWLLAAGGVLLMLVTVVGMTLEGTLMADAHAYWATGQPGFVPYQLAPGERDAFLYSPAFAQLVRPLTLLPWPVFAVVWLVLETSALVWLLRPLGLRLGAVALLWCTPELMLGNVLGFVAVATVLALGRWPQAWAFPLLTKPTYGVALLWHVVRREWRALAWALLTTLAVLAASVAIDPHMWAEWLRFLTSQAGGELLLLVRFVLAAALVVVGARTGRAWLVPFGMLLGTPYLGGTPVLALLAAVPRLLPQPIVWPRTTSDVARAVEQPVGDVEGELE